MCGKFALGLRDGSPRPFWLSLLGKSGTGKTHCAKQLYSMLKNHLNWNKAEYFHQFIYWPEFVMELRDQDSNANKRLLDMGKKWPLLVVDDIGAERDSTGFVSDKLSMLLGMRVGKWTVLTSNLDLAGLSKIDDRIASRIIREPGNLFIEMTTEDYGLRK